MITTVIFDLDQTLVDRDATFKLFLDKQYARFIAKLKLESIPFEMYYEIVKRYDNNGYSKKEEVYQLLCKDLKLDSETAMILYNDFNENYGFEPILFEDVHKTLADLQEIYTLALITNGRTKGQNAKIDNAKLLDYFKCIVISESEGIKKPNPEIFHRCLERLGIEANQAVYIGDNPENDIRAAQACSMKAIWKRNSFYADIDFADGVVNHLSELKASIASISQ